jgi:hypothetical protein
MIFLIEQGIEFRENAQKASAEVQGARGGVMRPLGMRRQIVENVVQGGSQICVAPQQAQIRVEAGCRGIVVSCAQVSVLANLAVGSRRATSANLQCVFRPTTP